MSTFVPLELSGPTPAAAFADSHPLEPLSAAEVAQVVAILKSAGKVSPTTRFVSISLHEPPKEALHGKTSPRPPREAFVVLFDNSQNACYEAVVSLAAAQLLAYRHVPGVQPTMTIDEQVECERAVLESEKFRAALQRHYGINDTRLVMVDIWSAGNYGSEEDRTLRLARPLCFLRSDPTDNGYARPIEGLRPVVDLNSMRVIRVEEHGQWPLPPGECNYAASRVPNQRRDLKPIEITQSEGASFTVNGYQVQWQNWSFVIGFNAREGLTLHHLRYNDQAIESTPWRTNRAKRIRLKTHFELGRRGWKPSRRRAIREEGGQVVLSWRIKWHETR